MKYDVVISGKAKSEEEAWKHALEIDKNCWLEARPNELLGVPKDCWQFAGEDKVIYIAKEIK